MKNEYRTAFGGFHPLSLIIWFLTILSISMFSTNPVILSLSLAGSMCFLFMLIEKNTFLKDCLFYLVLFILISLTNPLFSHNGVTPIFFLNDNAITLEAIIYGVMIALMIISVIIWCRCFNIVMTLDKFLYIFAQIIPKLSIVLSMAVRFIPLFKQKYKKLKTSQKAMGLYSESGIVNQLQSHIRIFSSLITWALESSVETGCSMQARGYGIGNRSSFSLFRFTKRDGVLLIISLLLGCICLFGIASGIADFNFYPVYCAPELSPLLGFMYTSFGLLAALPFLFELKETISWKYFVSKI